MLSSAFAYLNRTILHCFASSRRRLQNARRKNGRIKDKSVRNVPGPIKEEREIREGKAKNKKGGTGKWERVEKPQTTRSR